MIHKRLTAWVRHEKNPVKMQSLLLSPSKTLRKIAILKELLHSVPEWLRFLDFGLPNGSQTPPPPRCFQNGSQMRLSHISSASLGQPAQLSQLSSASSVHNCIPKWDRSWIDSKSSQRSFFERFCRCLLGCSQNLDLEGQPAQLS